MTLIHGRRTVAAGLSLALAVLTAVPALAAEATTPAQAASGSASVSAPTVAPSTISQEEALAIIRRYFAIPKGPGKVEAQLTNNGGQQVWQFMHTITRGTSSHGYGLGQMDATTGRIISFHVEGPELRPVRFGPLVGPYPEAEAWLKAWNLVREMYPEAAGTLRPVPLELPPYAYGNGTGVYMMTWVTHVNGIPDPASSVQVRMDKQTGEFLALDSQLSQGSRYLPAEGAIGAEAALAQFQAITKPTLTYLPVAQKDGLWVSEPSSWNLVYRFEQAGLSVDARSGKILDQSGQAWQAAEPQPLPESDVAPADRPSLPLTREQAAAYLKGLLEVPEEAELRQSGPEPISGSRGGNLVSIDWSSPSGFSAGATIDLKTGLIQYLRRDFGPQQRQPIAEVSQEQAEKATAIAVAAVQRYYPDLAGKVKLVPPAPSERLYQSQNPRRQSRFQRYENGIPVEGQMIYVGVDLNQMDWTDMNTNWTADLALPAPDGLVPAEEVAQFYLKGRKAELQYQSKPIMPTGRWGPPPAATTKFPVYRLTASQPFAGILDAQTGESVDWLVGLTGPILEQEAELEHHWAANELLLMASLGAIAPAKLNPDARLSRQEGLQLLTVGVRRMTGGFGGPMREIAYADMQSGSSAELIRQGLNMGLVRPEGEKPLFGPEQPLTRAEFALWTARALGLGSLARSPLKAEAAFTDLEPLTVEERNAVIFLEALGLVKSGHAFRGGEPITQAEAAALTARFILASRNP